jgi:hypothetical protein
MSLPFPSPSMLTRAAAASSAAREELNPHAGLNSTASHRFVTWQCCVALWRKLKQEEVQINFADPKDFIACILPD